MKQVLDWLLEGDVSIQYLTHRDLLQSDPLVLGSLQRRIEQEGYGEAMLSCRTESGHWGVWFYQPKWTCTHYVLLDLKHLGINPDQRSCRDMVLRALDTCQLDNGGINFAKTPIASDIAIDGMFLDYGCYFCPGDPRLHSVVEFVLSQRKDDGGYSWDAQAKISDPHTTICVLEGLLSHRNSVPDGQEPRIVDAIDRAVRTLDERGLCIGEDKRFLRFAFPHRYRYDLLRFLIFAASAGIRPNDHIEGALDWLQGKQQDGRWNLELIHPGAVHVPFERVREPSRFITLKAISVLKHFGRL